MTFVIKHQKYPIFYLLWSHSSTGMRSYTKVRFYRRRCELNISGLLYPECIALLVSKCMWGSRKGRKESEAFVFKNGISKTTQSVFDERRRPGGFQLYDHVDSGCVPFLMCVSCVLEVGQLFYWMTDMWTQKTSRGNFCLLEILRFY